MNYQQQYMERREIERSNALSALAELKHMCLRDNVAKFELHGYGSGDSPEGCDVAVGTMPDAADINSLDMMCAQLSGYDYNNEGGGYKLIWDGINLTLTAYQNETSEVEFFNHVY